MKLHSFDLIIPVLILAIGATIMDLIAHAPVVPPAPPTQWIGNVAYFHRLTEEEQRKDEAAFAWQNRDIDLIDETGRPFTYHAPKFSAEMSEEVEIGLRPDGTVVWRRVKP